MKYSLKQAKQMIVVIGLFIFSQQVFAQHIKIISATSQKWAGGVCCRYGTYYNIQLEIVECNNSSVVLDTLWMEGYGMDLAKYKIEKKDKNKPITISISENIVFDDGVSKNEAGYDASKKGVILTYHKKKIKMSLNLSPYITELEYLAYP